MTNKKMTAGDCKEMYDFLSKKGFDASEKTGRQIYEMAKKEGYEEGPYFGEIIDLNENPLSKFIYGFLFGLAVVVIVFIYIDHVYHIF